MCASTRNRSFEYLLKFAGNFYKMPPKKRSYTLTPNMQRLNQQMEQLILSEYHSSSHRDEINVAVVWIGYNGLHRLPCLTSKGCVYETLLVNFDSLQSRSELRTQALKIKKAFSLSLDAFVPKVLIQIIVEFMEIPVMPFVCELANSIWLDAWIIDLLANNNQSLEEDFLQCLKDKNPTFAPKIYQASCYPEDQISFQPIARRSKDHTCRGCRQIRECKIQCLCPYMHFCSLECKETSYHKAITWSSEFQSIYSDHSRACWEQRRQSARPKYLILRDWHVQGIQADCPLPKFVREIVDENMGVEELITSNLRPKLRNSNALKVLRNHFIK
jgi:hypothetical protein